MVNERDKEEYLKWASLSSNNSLSRETLEKQSEEEQNRIIQEFKENEKRRAIERLTKQYTGMPQLLKEKKQELQEYNITTLRRMIDRNGIRPKILSKFLEKNNERATELIVHFLKRHYTFKTLQDDNQPETWVYQDGIYRENGVSTIKEEIRNLLQENYTTYKANQVVEKIQADTFIDKDEFFNNQNNYPYLIPVGNGLLDMKNEKLYDFTPEIYFFNKINAEYDPQADCPNFKKFLSEIVQNPDEDTKVIQEMFGFSMVKDYKYEKAFMLYGEKGRNGKSKLLEVLTTLLGAENTSDVNLQDIETEKFEIGTLQNKLINISADISDHALQGTGMFKHLTGRDTIQAQRKFKTSIKFQNYAKLIFAANELPPVNTDSNAFWLRWVLLKFPYQFLPQKEIRALPENEKDKVRLQDQDIINKLTTEDELNGILNWALEGLHRLDQQKDFSNTQTAEQIKIEYTRISNSVMAFIMDSVNEDYDGMIEKQEFKKAYLDYCKRFHLKPRGDKQIRITLENNMSVTTKRKQDQFLDAYYWVGVNWKNHQGHYDNYGFKFSRKNFISQGGIYSPSYFSYHSDGDNSFKKEEQNLRCVNLAHDAKETKVVDFDTKLFINDLDGKTHYATIADRFNIEKSALLKKIKLLKVSGDVMEVKPGYYQKVD